MDKVCGEDARCGGICPLVATGTLLACLPVTALADPAIATVAWQGKTKDSLVVDGEGFGSGPRVRLFDTFDADRGGAESASGEAPSVFNRSPSELSGTSDDLDDLQLTREASLSGDASVVIVDTATDTQGRPIYREPGDETLEGTGTFQEIYFSYAIKDLGKFPGPKGGEDSFSERASAKDAWLMLGSSGNAGAKTEDDNPWTGNDLVIPSFVGGSFVVGGNSTELGSWKWQGEITDHWEFGDWNQMFFYAQVDGQAPLASGSGFFGFANDNKFDINRRSESFMSDPDKKHYWDRVKFGSWYRLKDEDENPVTGVKRVHDEVYIATGPNAHARVMLADASDPGAITRMHHGVSSQ